MRKKIFGLLAVLFVFLTAFNSIQVRAEGDIPYTDKATVISGHTMVLDGAAEALAKPEQGAEVVVKFNAGDIIFVSNETDEWYEIFYKGNTLYIIKSAISNDAIAANQASNEQLSQELDDEFKQKERMDKTYVESYEEQRARARRSFTFKTIIAVLIVAIIAASVVIGIKNAKLQKDTSDITDDTTTNKE